MSKSTSWLSRRRRAAQIDAPPGAQVVLHVGCGPRDHQSLHPSFRGAGWHEVRLDVDPGVKPDIVASMADMPEVPSQSFDAVWSAHNIEHVFAHEVPRVMAEFFRVLRPGGEVLLTTPDLQGVAEAIAAGRLEEALRVGGRRHRAARRRLRTAQRHRVGSRADGASDRIHPQNADAEARPGRLRQGAGAAHRGLRAVGQRPPADGLTRAARPAATSAFTHDHIERFRTK